jgi:Recombinational DNA repair protein (RecF pathway)
MNEKYQGLILFVKKIKDNDLFIKILAKNDEIFSGLVYGGNSSKKKNIYQIGYFIEFTYTQKNNSAPKSINADIIQPFINPILNNKFKSFALLNIISLINISILEGQKLIGIFQSVRDIINIISSQKSWISYYCEWLLSLLKIIGYQIDYKNQNDNRYFNLLTNEFTLDKINNSIKFPFKIFEHNKIYFDDLNNFFIIFENIFKKNHLDNLNYKMPINFINFKEIVLKELKNKQ